MIFDPKDIDRLGAMGINSCEYEQLLTNNIGSGLSIIPRLLDLFWKKPIADISSTPFNDSYASTGLPTEGDIYDLSYDFFNYLMLFNRGGKLDLYKYRQAEWKGPIIRLSRSDVPGLNLRGAASGLRAMRRRWTSAPTTSRAAPSRSAVR